MIPFVDGGLKVAKFPWPPGLPRGEAVARFAHAGQTYTIRRQSLTDPEPGLLTLVTDWDGTMTYWNDPTFFAGVAHELRVKAALFSRAARVVSEELT